MPVQTDVPYPVLDMHRALIPGLGRSLGQAAQRSRVSRERGRPARKWAEGPQWFERGDARAPGTPHARLGSNGAIGLAPGV